MHCQLVRPHTKQSSPFGLDQRAERLWNISLLTPNPPQANSIHDAAEAPSKPPCPPTLLLLGVHGRWCNALASFIAGPVLAQQTASFVLLETSELTLARWWTSTTCHQTSKDSRKGPCRARHSKFLERASSRPVSLGFCISDLPLADVLRFFDGLRTKSTRCSTTTHESAGACL